MFYDCSDEFDLNEIYQKLTGNVAPKVRANEFFAKRNELELLQAKMNRIMLANVAQQPSHNAN